MKPLVATLAFALLTAWGTSFTSLKAANPNSPVAELKHLQGTWNLVETDAQGQTAKPRVITQWIVIGNKLYLKSGGKTVPQGLIQIDSAHRPKPLDLVTTGSQTMFGIYELKGNQLKVCASPEKRPLSFVAQGNNVISVLERVKTPHLRRARLAVVARR